MILGRAPVTADPAADRTTGQKLTFRRESQSLSLPATDATSISRDADDQLDHCRATRDELFFPPGVMLNRGGAAPTLKVPVV